jgi:hypothetical protein
MSAELSQRMSLKYAAPVVRASGAAIIIDPGMGLNVARALCGLRFVTRRLTIAQS